MVQALSATQRSTSSTPRTAPAIAAPQGQLATAAPTAAVLQRCGGGTCTCGGACGTREVEDDALGSLLRSSVAERTLQREVQLQAPAGLIQRLCSPERLRELQSDMHSWCDSGISCNNARSCADVNERARRGQNCLYLRQQIQSECYDNKTDSGHAQQIQAVRNAIAKCDNMWYDEGCG